MIRPTETPPPGSCVGGGGIVGNGSTPNRQSESKIAVPGTISPLEIPSVTKVKSITASYNMLASSSYIPGKANTRTEVLIVVMRKSCRDWVVNGFEFEVGSALGLRLGADQVEVLVPPQTEIQGEIATNFPVILKV